MNSELWYFLDCNGDWKRTFLNENFDLKNKEIIFTLSWFWAETLSENTRKIINYWNKNNINVVTFDKSWNNWTEFSISSETNSILENVEKYSDENSQITFIWNSLLFPCFVDSYLKMSEDLKKQVWKILALSPVSDIVLTLENSLNFNFWETSKIKIEKENIKKYLEIISNIKWVKIDIEKVSNEIFNYNSDFLKKFHLEAWNKTIYFVNPKDKITLPENFYSLPNVNLKEISDLPWDNLFHNITASEYLPYIK